LDLARDICESIRVRIRENRFVWEDNSFEIGASIGIVPITATVGNAQEVLRAVDVAVYEAKDRGRNRVCVHLPEDTGIVQRQGEISWIKNINSALEQDRFVLYCQEIQPLQEDARGKSHFELLIRMIDVDGNIVEPLAFLPAAERFHLMPVIDRWVIHRAFVDVAKLRSKHPRLGQFNVNLSGQSLSDQDLLSYIRAELALSGISANDICFEITETAAIANLTAATQLIEDLRKLGFRFALDDFGSGLSSFGYLKTLKVDFLKIDGTFIRDISTDTADHAMVRSINQVAHVMGIKTVAEYIETEEIHIMATGIGIDYGQGIHIGVPQPLSHLATEAPGNRKFRIVK
jgi:EAL domain-containing protein (putative c-di-GMP-specific phosphodiesterase class I)